MFATLFALWRLGIAPWSPVVRANGRAVSSCPDNLQKNPETAAIFGRYSHPRAATHGDASCRGSMMLCRWQRWPRQLDGPVSGFAAGGLGWG